VNKVQGREAKQWIQPQDSINTSKMVDMAYTTAGYGLRPTSKYE
jgi:hypothetical protein